MKFHVVVTSRDSLQILTSKIQDGYRTAPRIFYLSGESNKFGTGSIYSSVDSRVSSAWHHQQTQLKAAQLKVQNISSRN